MKKTGPLEGEPGQGQEISDKCTALVARPPKKSQRHEAEPVIRCLAELFPRTFTAQRHLPHRPLKIGIDKDLRDAGILKTCRERRALAWYTGRRMYQLAVVEGAVRVDLDGNPAGIVTACEAEHAVDKFARLEALVSEHVRQARKKHAARCRQANQRSSATNVAPTIEKPQQINGTDGGSSTNVAPPRRLGLSDLKRAALARRNREAPR